jgi:transmembrane sensor
MEYSLRISKVIARHLEGVITSEESKELNIWLEASPANRILLENLENPDTRAEAMKVLDSFNPDHAIKRLSYRIQQKEAPVFSIRLWASRAAAVLLLIAGMGTLWLKPWEKDVADQQLSEIFIPAGRPGAILTMSDGRQVSLDSQTSDSVVIADPSGLAAVRRGDLLSYREESAQLTIPIQQLIKYNTLEVPRKAEFRVKLSDGTIVYLNAESRLKYPIHFPEGERSVEVQGEAYFEVAHHDDWPFKVTDSFGNITEVKGTSFNIKSYPVDEQAVVTLVSGQVQYHTAEGQTADLYPGQGAFYNQLSGEMRIKETNIQEATAWKNGRFIFYNRTMEEIMGSVARWYDIKVSYDDSLVTAFRFTADMRRYEDLSTLLELFASTESVSFSMKNETLHVHNKKTGNS